MQRSPTSSPPGNLDPHTAELAYHFYQAIPTAGPQRAITYSIQAGEWATSRLAYEDVPDHYRRALTLLEDLPSSDPLQRGNLLLALGKAELRAGHREQAQQTLRDVALIARTLNTPELLAHAALSLAPGFFALEVGVFDPTQVSLLEEALSALKGSDSPLRAQVLARLSTALVWSNAESRRTTLSVEAVEMAQRIGDTETLARALIARHEALWGPGDFQAREQVIEKIGVLASQVNDHEIQLTYLLLQTTAFLESGNIAAANEEILRYAHTANQTRQPQYLWFIDLFSAMRALMKGDFDTAESLAHRFLSMGRKAKDSNAYQSFGTHLTILRWEQDRSAEILPAVENFIARYPSVNAWKCVKLFLHQDLNQFHESRSQFEHFARSNFSSIACNPNRILSLCLLAEVCSALKDAERAKTLYAILLPERAHFAIIGFSTGFFGSVEERLGLLALTLGNLDEAADHFEQALSANERIGAQPWIARTQYHYAKMLLNQRYKGNVAKASSLVRRSSQTSKHLKMRNLARKLARLRISS
jgi:tetratricopeptide (TPR) repeat protein